MKKQINLFLTAVSIGLNTENGSRKQTILGIRPGMSPSQADSILKKAGYKFEVSESKNDITIGGMKYVSVEASSYWKNCISVEFFYQSNKIVRVVARNEDLLK